LELRDLEYKAPGAINKNISYELSALIDADSLVYGVFDYNRTLIWAGRGSLSGIDSLKEELSKNGITIRKVKVGILSSPHTIIPNDEFNTDTIRDMITHVNHIVQPEQYIYRNDYAVEHKLRVLYAVKKEVVKKLNISFENCQLIHVNFAQVESTETAEGQNHMVRLCFYESSFCMSIVLQDQLILCNTYRRRDSQDVLYFVALAFERLGLDHSSQTIEVGGFVMHNDPLLRELKKYFGGIKYATGYIRSNLKQSDEHYHLPLYMISKCA